MIVREGWIVNAVAKARKVKIREAKTRYAQDIAELDEWIGDKDVDGRSDSYIRALLIGKAEDVAGAKLATVRPVRSGRPHSPSFDECLQLIAYDDEQILRKVAQLIEAGGFSSDERHRLGHMLAGRQSAWKSLAELKEVQSRRSPTGRLA